MGVSLTTIASPGGRDQGLAAPPNVGEGDPKWPLRRTVAFVVLVCGGFWLCLAGAVWWLAQAAN